MAVLGLRRPVPAPMPPAMSPERERLAAVIKANMTAHERAAALASILDRATRQRRDAQDAAQRARERASAAAASAAVHATQKLLGDDPGPAPMTPAAARAALQECEDTEAAAVAAETNIEREIAQLDEAAARRPVALREAVGAVILAEGGPAIRALLTRIDAVQRELADLGWALSEIDSILLDQRGWSSAFDGFFEVQSRYDIAPGEWRVVEAISREKSVAAKAWRDAIEALKRDATAPVPTA